MGRRWTGVLGNYGAVLLAAASPLVLVAVACSSAEPSPPATIVTPTTIATTVERTVTAATPVPTRTPKPDVPADRETPSPTPTVDPSIAWTIGEPVPLPEDMTIVLGTGCNHCGGLHSTYVRFDAKGTTVLRDEGEEVHLGGYFADSTHLYLVTCTSNEDCSEYSGEPADPLSTLWESFDRGATWQAVETAPTLYSIVGRTPDGQLLMRQHYPERGLEYLYPSGDRLDAPAAAKKDWGPYLHFSVIAWPTPEHQLIDEAGTTVADFSSVVPATAELRSAVRGPTGAYFVHWSEHEERRTISRAAVLRDDGSTQLLDGSPFAGSGRPIWLRDGMLITSVEYSRGQLAEIPKAEHLVLQRIPTFVDLETRTLHPILEFLAPDAPQGRNTIEAVWQD